MFKEIHFLKDIRNHSPKLAKVFSQQPILFQANASLYSNGFQYSEAIKVCEKLAFPIKELQQKTLVTVSGFWLLKAVGVRVNLLTKKNLRQKTFLNKVE